MIWALIIGGVVLAAIFSSSLSKAKKEELAQIDLSERSELKMQAYVDYLRRTSENDEIKSMSEIETKEYISSAMREYNKGLKEKSDSYQGIFWIGVFGATIAVSYTENLLLFLPALAVGKWAYEQHGKAIKELAAKIKEKGLDPERLKDD